MQPDGDFATLTGTATSGAAGLTTPMSVENMFYRVEPQGCP